MAVSDSKLVDLHNRNNEHLFLSGGSSFPLVSAVGAQVNPAKQCA